MLTLCVTLPSLYVVSALAGSRLRFSHTLRLLLAAVVVNLALLASFGPVTGFFTVSTKSYAFMVLLNVLFFGVSGLVGLAFLRSAVDAVFGGEAPKPERVAARIETGEDREDGTLTPPPPPPRRQSAPPAKRVFTVWTLIYGVVGAQMAWVMRPFIGSPDMPFTLFRDRESNFFQAVLLAIRDLFS